MKTHGVLHRAVFALATAFAAVTVNFFLFRVLPGNAISNWSRVPGSSPQLQRVLAHQFGLDKPLPNQYVDYLGQLLHGNLGVSYTNQQPVLDNIVRAVKNTLPLVGIATLIAMAMGLWMGSYAARHRGRLSDHASTGTAVMFYALPTQWVGLMLLVLFGRYLPSAGMSDPFVFSSPPFWEHMLDIAKHMILPGVTLVLTIYGSTTLIVRSAMLEVMGEDFVLTARAKGLGPGKIMRRHVFRNAMLPIVTVIALSLGYIVAGAILVEIVFTWPGIGSALYDAVLSRDYPMMQGGFLVIALSVIFFNFLADTLYLRLDPRVGHER